MATYPTQSARFGDILLAVKSRLQTKLAPEVPPVPGHVTLDPTRIVLVKGGGYKAKFVAERHVRIRAVRGAFFGDHGGGRLAMPIARIVAVDIFTRSAMDPAGEDDIAMTEPEKGHFDMEDEVANYLVLWTPLSTPVPPEEPRPLTFEPLHPVQEVDDPDAPDPERYNGYLMGTIYLEAHYVSRFTQEPE